jgi:type II secretory pathway pseudopilin PulG
VRKLRAFTLLETVIAVGLLSLVIVLSASIGLPAMQAWMRASQRSDAQRSALVALARLRGEFPSAYPPSVACGPSQLTFLSSLDNNGNILVFPTGLPAWQSWVSFQCTAAGELLFNRNMMAPPALPAAFPASLIFPGPGGASSVVTQNLQTFLVSANNSTGLFSVNITAQVAGQQCSLVTSFYPGQ